MGPDVIRRLPGEDEVRAHARQVFDGVPSSVAGGASRRNAAEDSRRGRPLPGRDGGGAALPGEDDIGANPGSAGTKQRDGEGVPRAPARRFHAGTARARILQVFNATKTKSMAHARQLLYASLWWQQWMGGGSQEGWGRLTCGVVELELEPRRGCGQISSHRPLKAAASHGGANRRPRRGRRRQRRGGRRGGGWGGGLEMLRFKKKRKVLELCTWRFREKKKY